MSKVIVITGASEGIGAELARQLGKLGHKLVLAARTESKLKEVADNIDAETLIVPTDVTKRADVDNLRDRAIEKFGHVDVWVNNAGRGITRPVLELNEQDLDDMWDINVKSVMFGVWSIVPHMRERKAGQIINVSSFLGRVPVASPRSVYSACKAAVNSLTANLRNDLRGSGVNVTLIIPGMVATAFHANTKHVPEAGARPGAMPSPPPGMQIQSAEEVAGVIANTIAEPVPEVYTNPAHAPVAAKYYENVAAFEAQMGA